LGNRREELPINAPLESRDCPKPQENIDFNPLPTLAWDKENAGESARKLADYASSEARLAIQWYLKRKRSKKNWAQALRVLAIIATALAGLIPLLSGVLTWLPALWGSAALIIAATAVGLDHFFGFSSAWMRFLTTEMRIRQVLHRFLFDWEAEQAKLAGTVPDEPAVQALVQPCRDFIEALNRILRDEMDEWVNEFRRNLAEIDKAARAHARELGLGALTVVVTNGEQCADGWEVAIDERAPVGRRGRTAAFADLTAGSHVVRLSGRLGGRAVHAETAFVVAQGRTEEVTLSLD
jgi:hypothetical protein